jgi:hypothetical protein
MSDERALMTPSAAAEDTCVGSDLDVTEKRELRRKACRATLDALQELGGEGQRHEILSRALACGGFSSRELAAPPPEGAQHKYARLVDHNLSWALTNLKGNGAVENPSRGVWRLASANATARQPVAAEPPSAQRLRELGEMPYPRYLRTPEWHRTRADALLRAGNCCSLDVSHTGDLEVHHRTYDSLGSEQPSDLVVLCHACHQLYHGMFGRARRGRPNLMNVGTVGAAAPVLASAAVTADRRKRSWLARLLAS